MSDFVDLESNELIALSDKVVAEFAMACRRANEEERLRDRVTLLRQAVFPDESFERLRDEDPETARELLRLGALAMASSRMIFLTQKELIRRGIIPIPNSF
jgi:hypothetical protein